MFEKIYSITHMQILEKINNFIMFEKNNNILKDSECHVSHIHVL